MVTYEVLERDATVLLEKTGGLFVVTHDSPKDQRITCTVDKLEACKIVKEWRAR